MNHVVVSADVFGDAAADHPGIMAIRVASVADVEAAVLAALDGQRVLAIVHDAGDAGLIELATAELRRIGPGVVHELTITDPPDTELEPESAAVLAMLAEGLTIASAASRLGVSTRTATRRIERARQALGVSTTAEAVAAYGQRRPTGATVAAMEPVGRGDVLARVATLIESDAAVALCGEGAVGKSTLLALAGARAGRPVHAGGGQATLQWRDFWAVTRAAGLGEVAGDIEAVAAQVEAAVGPDLLVLDDVHLVDDASLTVLSALVGRTAMLVAARPEPQVLARLGEAGFTVVDLPPLTDAEIAALARQLAPGMDAADVARVVVGSGGLPLMTEFLCRPDSTSTIGRGLVPSVRSLPAEAAASALRLALADRPLAVDSETPLLVRTGVAVQSGSTVRLRHALVAEAVVAQASRQDVVAAHGALSREAADAGDVTRAARHAWEAGEHGRATDLALAAADASAMASDRAQLLALAAEACGDERAAELLRRAVGELSSVGRHHDVLRLAATVPAPDDASAAAIDLALVRAHWHLGDSATAVAIARRGLARVAGTGTENEAALLREILRCELLSVGVQPDHDAILARAREIVGRLGRGRAALLSVEGLVAYFAESGGPAEWAAGIEAAREEGDIDSLMRCSNNIVSWHEGSGDPNAGVELALEMADRAGTLGLGEWRSQFLALAANIHFHQGRYQAALDALDVVDGLAVDGLTRVQARHTRLAVLIDLGLLEAARPLLPVQLDREDADWLRDETAIYLAGAHAYWSGRPADALTIVEPLLSADDVHVLPWFARALAEWARHDLDLPSTPWPLGTPFRLTVGLEGEYLGVPLLRTDPARARVILDEASAAGRPWSYALALRAAWGAAEAARLAGDEDAVDRLLAVEKEAMEIGLEPLLTRIQRSLRLAGVRRAARRAPDRSGLLTERERTVLDLLSTGATYDEIARRLGVGRSTVRRLLDNAHAKLGTVGRFAAVAAVPAAEQPAVR